MTARDWLGSAVMLSFTLVAIQRWDATGSIFFLLLAADNLVKSFFFYTRSDATVRGNVYQTLIAYVSAALPLLYLPAADDISPLVATAAQLLMIGGFLLVAFATIDLGTRLGIAPARRGTIVTGGIYRFFKHPMYSGHAAAELGLFIANPLNAMIFAVSVTLYCLRIKWENRLLIR